MRLCNAETIRHETCYYTTTAVQKSLESINGSLGWLCLVIHHGRCRRDVIQKACASDSTKTPISKPLRKQLQWWLDILKKNRAFRPSQIWFRAEIQQSFRIQSDASGEQGFGFCTCGKKYKQDADEPPWIFDLIIQVGSPLKTIQTSIRIPRLGESLTDYLRHRGQAYRKKLKQL